MLSEERVLEIAGKFDQYPGGKIMILRGPGIVQFARALLAEHEGVQIAAAVEVRMSNAAGWCCEQGQKLGVPVCPECAATSAAYSADMRRVDAEKGLV